MQKLHHCLNALGRNVQEKVPYINNGGCCIFAALVGAELLRRNVKVTGFCTGKSVKGYDIDRVRRVIRDPDDSFEWANNGIQFEHIGLEINDQWHYDTDGLVPASKLFDGLPIHTGRFSIPELNMFSEDSDFWCRQFKRKHIRRIKSLITETFMEYDK